MVEADLLTEAESSDGEEAEVLVDVALQRLEQQRAYKKVELDVQPGVSYAIWAKLLRDRLDADSIRDNAYWEPVVWDMRPERCP